MSRKGHHMRSSFLRLSMWSFSLCSLCKSPSFLLSFSKVLVFYREETARCEDCGSAVISTCLRGSCWRWLCPTTEAHQQIDWLDSLSLSDVFEAYSPSPRALPTMPLCSFRERNLWQTAPRSKWGLAKPVFFPASKNMKNVHLLYCARRLEAWNLREMYDPGLCL